MASQVEATTIDPALLHRPAPISKPELALNFHSAGLDTIDWDGAVNLDSFVSCMLEAQNKIRRLPHHLALRLSSHLPNIWATIDARITQHLSALENGDVRDQPFEGQPVEQGLELEPDSDVDDDDHPMFRDLYNDLREFTDAKSRRFLVLGALSTPHRRHVHAIAHFMHFGHLSIGVGKSRMILLSRNGLDISPQVKFVYKTARNGRIRHDVDSRGRLSAPDNFVSESSYPRWNDFDADLTDTGVPAIDYSSADSSASASSHFSSATGFSSMSGFSNESNPINKRSKRKPQTAAFECTRTGCSDKFDRWCDLNHHSRIHLPYQERPYPCEQCEKRFLFPKDLRRHENTHTTGYLSQSRIASGEALGVEPGVFPA